MKPNIVRAAATAALIGMSAANSLQAGSFINGDFELGSGAERKYAGDTDVTGWTVLPDSIDWCPGWYWQTHSGYRCVDLSGDFSQAGGIQQAFDTVPGHLYRVSFYLAGNPETQPTTKHLEIVATGNSSQNFEFDTTGRSPSNMGWTNQVYQFVASSSTTALSFLSHDASGGGSFVDDVTVNDLSILTVTNLDDSGPGSLRQAIADAAPGDTIDFALTGTIVLTSGELDIGKDLTISGPGVTNLVIDGNHASRVFQVTNGTAFISSLTVSNGYAPGSGGAIANSAVLSASVPPPELAVSRMLASSQSLTARYPRTGPTEAV
ncbi:MAG: choice-of-anchor C family protein [Verrucomicrobia bacterium]|nr:choice-of-anchor C family protein [Verrucomicrobiota bacterium]